VEPERKKIQSQAKMMLSLAFVADAVQGNLVLQSFTMSGGRKKPNPKSSDASKYADAACPKDAVRGKKSSRLSLRSQRAYLR
jgi:hypothetical protein